MHSSLIRSDIWADNSLIRGDFERTIVWKMVCVWCGPWSHNRLDNGLIFGLIRGPFRLERSDQRQTVSSALRAHTVFRAHFNVIRGYFGLGWSDQRLLSSGTVWSEVTSGWRLNLGLAWNCRHLRPHSVRGNFLYIMDIAFSVTQVLNFHSAADPIPSKWPYGKIYLHANANEPRCT